jgi:diadenosine tetraphosphatase ApaH/serine/threonine PP2A family protein phosphatase
MNSIGVDKKVHLGDIVGFGPKPSETLALTLQEFNYIVAGQHDIAVVDEEESWGFPPQDKFAIDWTREKLSKGEVDVLSNLESSHKVGDILFTHESEHGFGDYRVAFIGSTHKPFVHEPTKESKPSFARTGISAYEVEVKAGTVVNVGSVGQPKDGDPRATYAIYDTEANTVTLYKIPYAVDRTVGFMQRAGFSDNAWQRLLFGR